MADPVVLAKLQDLLKETDNKSELARRLGVSRPTLYGLLKELKEKGTAIVAKRDAAAAARVVDRQINIVDQLRNANDEAWKIVRELAKDDPSTKVRALAEIRQQLELQAKLIQMLYDANTIREFQEEVLAVIGEAAPDVRDKIIARLKERRAVRTALTVS
ncbi:MAG: HTH domain-containing protein [Bacillota bacterium]|nr:HTH domain-containing protein [Bacillota bacterium]